MNTQTDKYVYNLLSSHNGYIVQKDVALCVAQRVCKEMWDNEGVRTYLDIRVRTSGDLHLSVCMEHTGDGVCACPTCKRK